jgi:hypothetical protein
MAGLVPAIHVFVRKKEDVDARPKAGRDGRKCGRRDVPYSPSTALVMMLRWISLEPP